MIPRERRVFSRALLSLDAVYVIAALALIGLRPLLTPLRPYDFWWHAATGRLIVASGSIPVVDSFSFTQAGSGYYNQGWLAQLLLYGLVELGGVPFVVFTQSLLLLVVYGLLIWLCARLSGRLRLSVAVVLGATMLLSFDNWNVRPQSYAFLCFVGFLFVLSEYRRQQAGAGGQGWLWLLPPLIILWVNLHGSFVLGGVLIALTLAIEGLKRLLGLPALSWSAWRRLFGWGALTAAALLLNPRGPAVLVYVSNLMGSSQVTDLVTEWAVPSIREPGGAIFFIFVIVLFLVLVYARTRPDLTDLVLMLAFLWLALGAQRNIVWFGFVATPLLVTQAATLLAAKPAPRRRPSGSPALNGVLISMLLLLDVLALPWVKPAIWPPRVGALIDAATPLAATEVLRRDVDPPARLFNEMGYGSYLIWALPEQKVFIDTRIELYPLPLWQDYIALSNGRDVARLLERHDIDGLLLSKEAQAALVVAARALPDWELRYEDDVSAYFVRR